MQYWVLPHKLKVLEAFGAVADGRIEIDPVHPDCAKCYSSSRNKFYEIQFDTSTNSIMSNDNSAYWKNEISYPMIGYLILREIISVLNEEIFNAFKGIKWKDINQKYKNDFDVVYSTISSDLAKSGLEIGSMEKEIENIFRQINDMKLSHLGKKKLPPKAY